MIAILPILAAASLGCIEKLPPVCPSAPHPPAAAERDRAPRTPKDAARIAHPGDEPAPAARKKKPVRLRGTTAAPGESRPPADDQIWNSEFYVNNAEPTLPRSSIRLASTFTP